MATAVQNYGRTPGTQKIGEAQEIFSQRAAAKREELRLQKTPVYTVFNFNPVDLTLQGIFSRYKVPSPEDPRLPQDVSRVVMNWRGRDYLGHALVIREPLIEGRNLAAHSTNGLPAMQGGGEAIIDREVVAYLPAAIAYAFLEHYSPVFSVPPDGQIAAPPKDVRRICGVLVCEGRVDAISAEALAKNGGKIRVPVARVLTVGRTNQRVYETVEYPLDAWKDQMFEGQRRYADTIISRAQQKFVEGKGREEIGSADRTWYRWAIRMGYTGQPKEPDKTWLNELISMTSVDGENNSFTPLRKCQSCRTAEPEANTPFCPKCGAPIDTFTTFMAGFPVAESWLMALRGEEREEALAEFRRRKQGFDAAPEDAPEQTQAAAPAKQPRKGGRFASAKDESAVADSAAMPGEE